VHVGMEMEDFYRTEKKDFKGFVKILLMDLSGGGLCRPPNSPHHDRGEDYNPPSLWPSLRLPDPIFISGVRGQRPRHKHEGRR
jgi:hypothetical protein